VLTIDNVFDNNNIPGNLILVDPSLTATIENVSYEEALCELRDSEAAFEDTSSEFDFLQNLIHTSEKMGYAMEAVTVESESLSIIDRARLLLRTIIDAVKKFFAKIGMIMKESAVNYQNIQYLKKDINESIQRGMSATPSEVLVNVYPYNSKLPDPVKQLNVDLDSINKIIGDILTYGPKAIDAAMKNKTFTEKIKASLNPGKDISELKIKVYEKSIGELRKLLDVNTLAPEDIAPAKVKDLLLIKYFGSTNLTQVEIQPSKMVKDVGNTTLIFDSIFNKMKIMLNGLNVGVNDCEKYVRELEGSIQKGDIKDTVLINSILRELRGIIGISTSISHMYWGIYLKMRNDTLRSINILMKYGFKDPIDDISKG